MTVLYVFEIDLIEQFHHCSLTNSATVHGLDSAIRAQTKLFYLAAWENKSVYRKGEQQYSPGNRYIGSVPLIDLPDDPGTGAIRALNLKTGERVWEYKLLTKPWAGVLSTAGKLVFGGSDEGYFFALDAETGKEVWRMNTGGIIRANPVTFMSEGKQIVAVAAGSGIFAFELTQ